MPNCWKFDSCKFEIFSTLVPRKCCLKQCTFDFVHLVLFVRFRTFDFVRSISFVRFRSFDFVRSISFVRFRSFDFVRSI